MSRSSAFWHCSTYFEVWVAIPVRWPRKFRAVLSPASIVFALPLSFAIVWLAFIFSLSFACFLNVMFLSRVSNTFFAMSMPQRMPFWFEVMVAFIVLSFFSVASVVMSPGPMSSLSAAFMSVRVSLSLYKLCPPWFFVVSLNLLKG